MMLCGYGMGMMRESMLDALNSIHLTFLEYFPASIKHNDALKPGAVDSVFN